MFYRSGWLRCVGFNYVRSCSELVFMFGAGGCVCVFRFERLLTFERLKFDVRCYIILLYIIISYIILFLLLIYLLFFPYSSQSLPIILSSLSSLYNPFPFLLNPHLLLFYSSFVLFPSIFFPPILLLHSFYTCRHLDILIYIQSRYSIILFQILTPHVLSDGNVEWCSFISIGFWLSFELMEDYWCSWLSI